MKIWKHLLYCYVLNNGFKFSDERNLEVRRTQPKAGQKVKPERRTLDLFTKKNPKKYLINVYVCSFSIDKKRWKGKRQKSITNKTNGKGVVDCIFRFPPIDFEQNKLFDCRS